MTAKPSYRRMNLSRRDLEVLAALASEGPIPKADLFWRFFASADERERKANRESRESFRPDLKRGHVPLIRLANLGLIEITDLDESSRPRRLVSITDKGRAYREVAAAFR